VRRSWQLLVRCGDDEECGRVKGVESPTEKARERALDAARKWAHSEGGFGSANDGNAAVGPGLSLAPSLARSACSRNSTSLCNYWQPKELAVICRRRASKGRRDRRETYRDCCRRMSRGLRLSAPAGRGTGTGRRVALAHLVAARGV
jgi:hypothetical protein